jgi:hypothetical protein
VLAEDVRQWILAADDQLLRCVLQRQVRRLRLLVSGAISRVGCA